MAPSKRVWWSTRAYLYPSYIVSSPSQTYCSGQPSGRPTNQPTNTTRYLNALLSNSKQHWKHFIPVEMGTRDDQTDNVMHYCHATPASRTWRLQRSFQKVFRCSQNIVINVNVLFRLDLISNHKYLYERNWLQTADDKYISNRVK